MNGAEATAKADRRKAEIMPDLLSLSRTDKEALLVAASKYRSGNDRCNSFYMGSLATAGVMHRLGKEYGECGIANAAPKASDKQIDSALDYAFHYIDYMRENPVNKCPCCGQIV